MSITAEKPGTTDEYHADTETVSKTMLNEFCDSPVQFNLIFNTGELERKHATVPMQLGTIMHSILLEGSSVGDVCEVFSDDCFKSNGAINPKPAGEFRDSIAPKIAVKQAVRDDVIACRSALSDTPLMKAIHASTETERRHDGTVHGVPSRCKPDILCDMGDHILIYDLKFCDPSPGAFNRSAKRFRYWLQDAHYSAVIKAETGKPVQFRFFAVEPVFPFRVQSYWYTPRQREIARDYHTRKLGELRECYETNVWQDNWPNELELNPWDVGYSAEEAPELEGFDE